MYVNIEDKLEDELAEQNISRVSICQILSAIDFIKVRRVNRLTASYSSAIKMFVSLMCKTQDKKEIYSK